jgi:hypothetical protein
MPVGRGVAPDIPDCRWFAWDNRRYPSALSTRPGDIGKTGLSRYDADRIVGKRGLRHGLRSEIMSIEDTFDENVLVCNDGAEHCESGRVKFCLYGDLRNPVRRSGVFVLPFSPIRAGALSRRSITISIRRIVVRTNFGHSCGLADSTARETEARIAARSF